MDIKKITTQIVKSSTDISKSVENLSKQVTEIQPIKKLASASSINRLEKDSVELSKEALFARKLELNFSKSPIKVFVNGKESEWSRYVNSQMGSQNAFWARNNNTGELFYVKYAPNESKEGHIASEIYASKLYKLAGFEAPEVLPVTINGKIKALASKYVPDLQEPKIETQLQQGFGADAWLANWDSLLYGNTFVKDGKIYKIDNGGSLNYRAMGKLKSNFGNVVEELVTLVDGRNLESTSVYSSMSHSALVESIKKVCDIKDIAIRKSVNDPELAQVLIERKNYMKKVLDEMQKTPKGKETCAEYFTRIVNAISKQGIFDSETVLDGFSKFVQSKISVSSYGINMPGTKTIAKDLIKEIKSMEKRGVSITRENIVDLLQNIVEDGFGIKPSRYNCNSKPIIEMDAQYIKMFSFLLKIAEKTPKKDGETASSYLTRVIKVRERRLKQLEDFRIKNIKSKLIYETETVQPEKTVLTETQRAQAINELEEARKKDALTDVFVIPKLSKNATDKEIYKAWQDAHLGSFTFSSNSLQKAVMGIGGRYNSKHPIKTKTKFEAILDKDYKQDFDIEPVYHWFGRSNPEKYISENIPKNGEIYTFPNLQCCSTHKHYAETDFGDHMLNQNIKFVIHPKSETSRAYNLGYNQEVVYPAKEQFRILDKDCIEYIDPQTGNGVMRWEIHMQEI